VPRDIFLRVNRPDPYGNNSSLSSADVMNEWSCTSTASIHLCGLFDDSIILALLCRCNTTTQNSYQLSATNFIPLRSTLYFIHDKMLNCPCTRLEDV
jgi:hypothetical protein